MSMQETFFHEQCCVCEDSGTERFSYQYNKGPIMRVAATAYDPDTGELGTVRILFRDGTETSWKSKYSDPVYQEQTGIPVSADGSLIFLPTWERGFHCLNARTGERVWDKRYGVTTVFVGQDTLICHRPYRALQMLDLRTGVLLHERPSQAWGFTSLNHQYIICHVKKGKHHNQWDIIRAATLEAVQSFSQKELTGNHEDYVVRRIMWKQPDVLCVSGFKNVFVADPKHGEAEARPYLEFCAEIHCVDLSDRSL